MFGHHVPTIVFLILTNGFQGVALFFMLSGFVLALPYFAEHRSMDSARDALMFYRRRLRRLFPLFAIVSLVSMAFVYPHFMLSQGAMLFTATFIFWQSSFMIASNWVLWSLAVEAWFSVFFPAILFGVRRFGIVAVLLGAICVSVCARMAGMLLAPDLMVTPLANGPIGRLDEFVWGILLAHLFVHGKRQALPFGLFVGCVSLLFGFYLFSLYLTFYTVPVIVRAGMSLFVDFGFFLIIDALLRGRPSIVRWFLESAWLQMIGLMCYSLYVWHGIVMLSMSGNQDIPHLMRYFLLIFPLGFLSYRYIEFGFVSDIRLLLPTPRTVHFHLAHGPRSDKTSDTPH